MMSAQFPQQMIKKAKFSVKICSQKIFHAEKYPNQKINFFKKQKCCFLIILIMILLRLNLSRFFHFTKPALSTLSSLKDVEAALQKRLVSAVKATNAQTLQHYSLVDSIKQKLAVQVNTAKAISQRTVNLSIVNPRTLEHRTIEVSLSDGLSKSKLPPEQFGFPFTHAQERLVHFSESRGTPNFQELSQYGLDDRSFLIFNLPQNVSEQDIQITIRETPSKISFKYCVLGLPAYARVQFQTAEELNRCLSKFQKKKMEFGERVAKIKKVQDAQRLKLANRRLVIEIDENAKLQSMIINLSRFGRVIHVDWPIEAFINPTVADVKQFYKDSNELIKINKYEANGSIESEYYPSLEIWNATQDEREVDNIIDKIDTMKESFQNRARFARNVDIYAGKEQQLILKNKGYCVITYSTSQECQNCYFSEGGSHKMELVGNKLEFQYDPLFKKQLLRQVDNEYLIGKKNDFGRKQEADAVKKKQLEAVIPNKKNVYRETNGVPQDYQSYYILQRIIMNKYMEQATKHTKGRPYFKRLNKDNNQFLDWEHHLTLMKETKANQKTKTFDELAEIQLYGRVLPKDKNIEKMKVESIKLSHPKQIDLIKQNNLITNKRKYLNKKKFYDRQRIRNNRITDQYLGITVGKNQQDTGLGQAEGQAEVQSATIPHSDAENIGKSHFSTARPQILYRKRTADETANYLRRYNQFVRSNIYEYMGVFHDKLIEEAVIGQPEVLNPQSLKFLDGSPLLTEEQLLQVLQFRRDFSKAQQDYDNYVYGREFIKSSGFNIHSLHANLKQHRIEAIQHLIDVGTVQQTRKVDGNEQELKEKVKILNTDAAEFGQEYRIQNHNDKNYLVKIRKLQHLMPIDRIAHLQKTVQEIDNSITTQQASVFQQHYKIMKETGVIPDKVRQVFGIEQQIGVAELMSQMGIVYGVSKKDLEITQRFRSYSKQEINDDINNQFTIERQRKKKRKLGSSDFVKDPSEIYVKDREGYFRVSRYRQI